VLEIFDLRWAEKLHFRCGDTGSFGTVFPTALLPSQLTNMTLNDIEFEFESLLGHGPRRMPRLTELRLEEISFEGRLQDYFDCPKLKKLYLNQVEFHSVRIAGDDDHHNDYNQDYDDDDDDSSSFGISVPLSSSISFPSIPELDYLYVCNGKLDGKLTDALQSCPLLQHLSTESCSVKYFIPSFTTAIADSRSLPSLKSLCIDNSWRAEPQSRKEFVQYCVNQRPGLAVFIRQ
jgi:hypothetical protein